MSETATIHVLDQLAETLEANATALADAPASASIIKPSARTSLVVGTPTEVTVRAGRHSFTIDEPASLGGGDAGANPVEHVLAALGACQVISYQVWAANLGIRIDDVTVNVSGELDVRGFFGLDDNVRPGFQSIHVDAHVSGPESPERYTELTNAVEAHCPVLDALTNGVPVTSTISYS